MANNPDELTQALASIANSVIDAKEFILAELPDVIQQLLTWHMTKALVLVAVSFLFILAYAKFVHYVFKHKMFDNYRTDIGATVGTAGGGMTAILVFMFLMENLLTAVQIWVAPKVWLIEYLRHLL